MKTSYFFTKNNLKSFFRPGWIQAVRQAAVGSELMVIKERQYAVELTIGIKMSVPVFVLYPFVFTVVETGKIIDDAAV